MRALGVKNDVAGDQVDYAWSIERKRERGKGGVGALVWNLLFGGSYVRDDISWAIYKGKDKG